MKITIGLNLAVRSSVKFKVVLAHTIASHNVWTSIKEGGNNISSVLESNYTSWGWKNVYDYQSGSMSVPNQISTTIFIKRKIGKYYSLEESQVQLAYYSY